MEILGLLLLCAAAIFLGFLGGFGSIYVFNKIPAKWLCDYDETPTEAHLPPRINKYPWGPLFGAVLAAAFFKTGMSGLIYAAAAFPALWLLLLVGLADKKYRIIPDEFIILLAVTGIGFAADGGGLLDSLLGALLGGGVMVLIIFIGWLVTRGSVLGMGDAKLMAACGLIAGIWGIVAIFVLMALASAAVFGALLAGGRVERRDEMALGPFIAFAAAVYIIFAEEIHYFI